jgi:hypothetical protein
MTIYLWSIRHGESSAKISRTRNKTNIQPLPKKIDIPPTETFKWHYVGRARLNDKPLIISFRTVPEFDSSSYDFHVLIFYRDIHDRLVEIDSIIDIQNILAVTVFNSTSWVSLIDRANWKGYSNNDIGCKIEQIIAISIRCEMIPNSANQHSLKSYIHFNIYNTFKHYCNIYYSSKHMRI